MQKLLLTILISIFLALPSNAENHLQPESEIEKFNFYWTQMPTVCAPRGEVERWLVKHEFTPVSVSFGRENGRQENNIVYAITLYINKTQQMTAVAETQNSPDKCVLFRTFDLQVNPSLYKPSFGT